MILPVQSPPVQRSQHPDRTRGAGVTPQNCNENVALVCDFNRDFGRACQYEPMERVRCEPASWRKE